MSFLDDIIGGHEPMRNMAGEAQKPPRSAGDDSTHIIAELLKNDPKLFAELEARLEASERERGEDGYRDALRRICTEEPETFDRLFGKRAPAAPSQRFPKGNYDPHESPMEAYQRLFVHMFDQHGLKVELVCKGGATWQGDEVRNPPLAWHLTAKKSNLPLLGKIDAIKLQKAYRKAIVELGYNPKLEVLIAAEGGVLDIPPDALELVRQKLDVEGSRDEQAARRSRFVQTILSELGVIKLPGRAQG